MTKYKLISSDEFLKEWRKEVQWTKKNWGTVHAKQYFTELRSHYKNQLQNNPHLFVNPNHGLAKGYVYQT